MVRGSAMLLFRAKNHENAIRRKLGPGTTMKIHPPDLKTFFYLVFLVKFTRFQGIFDLSSQTPDLARFLLLGKRYMFLYDPVMQGHWAEITAGHAMAGTSDIESDSLYGCRPAAQNIAP